MHSHVGEHSRVITLNHIILGAPRKQGIEQGIKLDMNQVRTAKLFTHLLSAPLTNGVPPTACE
jgi:hypothetical protein